MFKTAFSHFLIMEFKRFYAIFPEIENEVSVNEIGSRRLVHQLLELLSAKKHFMAVMARHRNRSVLRTDILQPGKTFTIKAYHPLVSFFSEIDLS